MPKLLTPQQYENSLDELNELRPLQIADEVKRQIDIPVCNKLPVSTKKAVSGLLTKGTQQGALLTELNTDYTAYEKISQYFSDGSEQHCVTFAQEVNGVLCVQTTLFEYIEAWWTNSTYALQIMAISLIVPTYLPFIGTDLYVYASDTSIYRTLYMDFYGFY